MKLALAYLTKDRPELTRQTAPRVIQSDFYDTFWIDGSKTEEGKRIHAQWDFQNLRSNVLGGPDAAVCYALTEMLASPKQYEFVGICEQDVLLPADWHGSTMALFDRGAAEGLCVGAVSARCYEDRILIQRDGYALCHNLGFGHIIMTREAARLWLTNWRTGHTLENRRLFAQLTGRDIGRYWAFRTQEQLLCSDWGLDRTLAAHGLASLALTPTDVEMIGQSPPLADQGLTLAREPVELLRDDIAFGEFVEHTGYIRTGERVLAVADKYLYDTSVGTWTIFPHQLPAIGAAYEGDWRLKWTMGFGPFSWKAGDKSTHSFPRATGGTVDMEAFPGITIPISGPCEILCSGGSHGGQIVVEDTQTGYRAEPHLPPEENGQIVALPVPVVVGYRCVVVTARSPGVIFYGLRVREPQPSLSHVCFDHNTLPPV